MSEYEHGNGWTLTMPRQVVIGNRTYKVELMKPGQEREGARFGECVSNDLVIRLGQMQPRQQARDTFLHEILHAVLWVYGINSEPVGSNWEEQLCLMLPMALMLLKRDNPDVWAWIFVTEPVAARRDFLAEYNNPWLDFNKRTTNAAPQTPEAE